MRLFVLPIRLALAALVVAMGVQLIARDAHAGDEFCRYFDGTMDPLAFPGGCYPQQGDGEALVIGRAIVGDRYAPIDTPIEAFNGDISCGSTPIGFRTFELQLQNCASPGATVRFEVGGQRAAETMTWPGGSPNPTFLSLSVKSQHAWYWFQRLVARPPALGITVQARIGNTVCGQAMIEEVPRGFVFFLEERRGFWKLVVPESSLAAGCGSPGAQVSFVVNGAHSITSVAWQAGVQQVDVMIAGDPNCDLVVASTDAALILQAGAGLLRSALQCQAAADVNQNGATNAIDATLALQFAAGLVGELGG